MPTIRFDRGRPTATERALADWAFAVAEGMEEEQEGRDFVATGESLRDYEVIVAKPNEIHLETAPYIRFSVEGRPPGGFPPLNMIADWIEVKPLPIPIGYTLNGFAYVIARRIATEGNAVWRGDRAGIPMQEIIERSFDDAMEENATLIAIEASNKILKSMSPNKFRKVK
jgi:hypothetical protein